MDIEAGTERAMDLMLIDIQAEVEGNYEKYMVQFKGGRMAHHEARPHPQAPAVGTPAAATAMQPGAMPQTLTPKNGAY